MITLEDIEYTLPEDLIAHHPSASRSTSRLMTLNAAGSITSQGVFSDIIDLLPSNALLVFNNTKVMACRFYGAKSSGAKLELFLLKDEGDGKWRALTKCSGKIKVGHRIVLDAGCEINVCAVHEDGERSVQFPNDIDVYALMDEKGSIPLPPYIARENCSDDAQRYQTVYAQKPGAVAAPTAGLHFDDALLAQLDIRGIETAYVTLHVGMGTFRPISDSIEEHTMHSEEYHIDSVNAQIIEAARLEGRAIIPVGTTSVRTLESTFALHHKITETSAATSIFLYPPYSMNVCSGLITNFHLPKSTLLLLVSCFIPLEALMSRYQDAIKEQYRFFSYGDAMYIQPR